MTTQPCSMLDPAPSWDAICPLKPNSIALGAGNARSQRDPPDCARSRRARHRDDRARPGFRPFDRWRGHLTRRNTRGIDHRLADGGARRLLALPAAERPGPIDAAFLPPAARA